MASDTEEKHTSLRGKDKHRHRRVEPVVDEEEATIYLRIGEQLRARRLEVGLNLDDVVRELNIRLPHLIALEEGRFKDLPGRIYATGFLKNYAEHLGLDADALLQAVKDECAAPEDARLVFPTPPPESRRPHGWIMLIALIVAVGVYGAWYYANHRDRIFAPHTAKPPTTGLTRHGKNAPAASAKASLIPMKRGSSASSDHSPKAAASAKAESPTPVAAMPTTQGKTKKTASAGTNMSEPASTPTKGGASPANTPSATSAATGADTGDETVEATTGQATSAATPSSTPATSAVATSLPSSSRNSSPSSTAASSAPSGTPSGSSTTASPPSDSSTPAATTTPAATASPSQTAKAYGSTSPDVQVVLKARSDAWVTVSDGSGKVIFPGHILQPGDTYSVPPDDSNAVLWTGNIGGLKIIVNGKTMPRVGAIGQSERNIPLDPKQLIAFIKRKRH